MISVQWNIFLTDLNIAWPPNLFIWKNIPPRLYISVNKIKFLWLLWIVELSLNGFLLHRIMFSWPTVWQDYRDLSKLPQGFLHQQINLPVLHQVSHWIHHIRRGISNVYQAVSSRYRHCYIKQYMWIRYMNIHIQYIFITCFSYAEQI